MRFLETFYKDGFFGYGEKGDFKMFSFFYFLPIVILIAAIILTYIYRDKIKNYKHERRIRFILAAVMLFVEMSYYWRLIYVGTGNRNDPDMLAYLPLQICEWTCIFGAFMLMSENKSLFDINVFVCLTLGLLPMVYPAGTIPDCGPKYYRYYQYYLEHMLPIYTVFYMMFVKGFKFNPKAIWKPIAYLVVLATFAIIIDINVEYVDYLYLKPREVPILPDNVFLSALIYLALLVPLFSIEVLVFWLINKRKKPEKLETEGLE